MIRGIRAVFGVFLFIAFSFPFLLSALYMAGVSNWVLDRNFYVDLLDDEVWYDALLQGEPDIWFNETTFEGDLGVLNDHEVAEAVALGLQQVVSADYLRDQVTGIVDSLFIWFDNMTNPLVLAVDLQPLKASLTGDNARTFATTVAQNLPACAPGEEPSFEGENALACIPDNMTATEAASVIREALPTYLETIPDTLNLADSADMSELDTNDVPFGFTLTDLFGSVVWFLLILALVFWVLTALVGGASRRGIFTWLGITLLIPAMIVFSTGLIVRAGFVSVDNFGVAPTDIMINGEPASPEITAAFEETARTVLFRVSDGFLTAGGIGFGLAVALIGMNYFLPKRREEDLLDDPRKRKIDAR